MDQRWLPGVEAWLEGGGSDPRPKRRRGKGPKSRPPTVDKLVTKAPPRVRELFEPLRDELRGERAVSESVHYDDSSGAFMPAYALRDRELLRFHLEPLLTMMVTLEPGESQLARLLASPVLDGELKAQAVRCARKSGRRVYLAFPARNPRELAALKSLLRERLALER